MKKFNYPKWKSEKLPKLLTEQSTNMDPNTGLPINFTGGQSPYPGSGPNGNTYKVRMIPCGGQPGQGTGLAACFTLNGLPSAGPQIGQAFKYTGGGAYAPNSLTVGDTYYLNSWVGSGNFLSGPPGVAGIACMVNPSGGYPQMDFVASSCPTTNPTGTTCPSCDAGQHTWGNASNWQNNFTNNLTNASWFNNPGQPCQFLNARIAQWDNQQSGINNCVTSAQYNMLECKKKYVTAVLKPQYNC